LVKHEHDIKPWSFIAEIITNRKMAPDEVVYSVTI